MSEAAGRINEYVCEKCGGITRTINRNEGTTPFLIRCRLATIGCDGMAKSSFYRVSQQKLPGYEWILPTPKEFDEWVKSHKEEDHREALAQHVAKGGMLLCKLDAIRLHDYGFRMRRG